MRPSWGSICVSGCAPTWIRQFAEQVADPALAAALVRDGAEFVKAAWGDGRAPRRDAFVAHMRVLLDAKALRGRTRFEADQLYHAVYDNLDEVVGPFATGAAKTRSTASHEEMAVVLPDSGPGRTAKTQQLADWAAQVEQLAAIPAAAPSQKRSALLDRAQALFGAESALQLKRALAASSQSDGLERCIVQLLLDVVLVQACGVAYGLPISLLLMSSLFAVGAYLTEHNYVRVQDPSMEPTTVTFLGMLALLLGLLGSCGLFVGCSIASVLTARVRLLASRFSPDLEEDAEYDLCLSFASGSGSHPRFGSLCRTMGPQGTYGSIEGR